MDTNLYNLPKYNLISLLGYSSDTAYGHFAQVWCYIHIWNSSLSELIIKPCELLIDFVYYK